MALVHKLLLILGGLSPRSSPVLRTRAVAGGLMDQEMLQYQEGENSPYHSGAQWHRDQRDRINFETACYYTHEAEIPLGCQYNRSVQEEWRGDDRRTMERFALETFYRAMGGQNWRYNDNWNKGDPCWDFWYGITCDEHGHVIYIELADNRLKGLIPININQLTHLLKLDLSSTAHVYMGHPNKDINVIRGSFPSIKDMRRISEIEVSGNEIEALPPDLVENARSLRVISAERNQLTRFIDGIGNFERLHTLELGRNFITGTLPDDIGQLKQARIMQLEYNDLRGPLPAEAMKEMTLLENLDLSHNVNLDGNFPNTTVSAWTNMNYLSIFNTSLVGYVGQLCSDIPFCWQFMYDTHKDMTWAGPEDVGHQGIAAVVNDAREYCNQSAENCPDSCNPPESCYWPPPDDLYS